MGIIQYWKHYCVTNTDNISHPQKTQTCFTLTTKEVFHLIKILFFFFNRALFIIARTWKQSRCPSAEEWIRKFSTYTQWNIQFSSVTQSCLTVRPHGLQHTRPPCPLPTPRVYPNSCPLSQWCHPTISSSVFPFSSCPQSFPASKSFPMSWLFAWGGQNIGVSASASVLSMNTQDWSPLGWIGWISLQSKGLSRVFSNTTVQKHQFFSTQLSL